MYFLKLKLNWQESWPWLSMVGFVVISRWWLKSHYLFHLDSVQFALALNHWDITKHQPHPPGYILYVGLGKIVNAIVSDPNLAFIVLSIIATLAGLWAIAWLGNQWWGRVGGIIAGILYVTNASVWFHGLVAEVYIVETALALWVITLTYRYWRQGRDSDLIWLGLLLGLLGGVRQVGELALFPFVGYVIWCRHQFHWSAWGKLLGSLIVGNLIWFIPLMWLSGGVVTYWTAIRGLWTSTVIGNYRHNQWGTIVANFSLLAQTIKQSSPIIFVILGFGVLPYLAVESRRHFKINRPKLVLWLWWICPSLILLSLILTTNPGYVLTIVTMMMLLGAGAIMNLSVIVTRWQPRWASSSAVLVVGLAVFAQVWSFFTTPISKLEYGAASLVTIRETDRNMSDILGLISHYDVAPEHTVMVVDGGYLVHGLRHMQYYLPQFDVYGWFAKGWPGVSGDGDKFVFVHGPQTFMSVTRVKIPADTTKVIVLGDYLFPTAKPYLSNMSTTDSKYSVGYFDLTKPEVKQSLIDTNYFQFFNN
jgi:hypothetical protein